MRASIAARWMLVGMLVGLTGLATAQPHRPAPASIGDFRVHDEARMDRRAQLLARAQAALERGDLVAANEDFDRASMMLHAPDTEMGLVRTYMQAGEYRRALAFAAHVAGAHREAANAGALHAWLLALGGQQAFAQRVLQQSLQTHPDDEVARMAQAVLAGPHPRAEGPMLRWPHRMAPHAGPTRVEWAPPSGARVIGSGVLIDEGRRALVPLALARDASEGALWVRDGLGRISAAERDTAVHGDALQADGVAVLRLTSPLDPPQPVAWATREAFGGSAAFALDYSPGGADPAWPWQRAGFLGALPREAGPRPLGIALDDGPHGGPVFDAQARLIGMALRDDRHGAVLLPATRWQAAGLDNSASAGPQAHTRARAADEIYESGMRIALQVLRLPREDR